MSSNLSDSQKSVLRELGIGIMAGKIDPAVANELTKLGLATQGLGGWVLTAQGKMALGKL